MQLIITPFNKLMAEVMDASYKPERKYPRDCRLEAPVELVVGSSIILFSAEGKLSLHEGGSVCSGNVVGPAFAVVGGRKVAFDRGPNPSMPDIHFYPDGVLRHGYLREETVFEVGGRIIAFVGEIYFNAEGRVQSANLARDTLIEVGENEILFSPSEGYRGHPSVTFYRSGALLSGNLTEDRVIRDRGREVPVTCGAGVGEGRLAIYCADVERYNYDLMFNEDGTLWRLEDFTKG
jgi:hypothetical protein